MEYVQIFHKTTGLQLEKGAIFISRKILIVITRLLKLILTDLDNRSCPSELLREWVDFDIHPNLIFNIAVKEAETWLLSDRENFASYFGISINLIERDTESIADPKKYLISLARRSRKRSIRNDIVPQGTASVGPGYNSCLAKFIYHKWNFENAMKSSKSLNRMVNKLKTFIPVKPEN